MATIAIVLGWSIKIIIPVFKYRIRKVRGRKMVGIAKSMGPFLYRNFIKGSNAICRVDDFKISDVSTRKPDPWEPVGLVKVRPTFPFRKMDDPLRTKMHVVVTPEELDQFFEKLVLKLTGFKKKQVDNQNFDRTVKILVANNNRLFVPFAEELSPDEGGRQAIFYGSTPEFAAIEKYLLS